MNNSFERYLFASIFACSLLLTACGGGGGSAPKGSSSSASGGGNSSSASSVIAATSHHPGEDCMASCHKAGGAGAAKGIFTVAGTVTNSSGAAQVGATVKLYRHQSSIVNVTLTTDSLGNFYTTQAVADINATNVTGVDAEITNRNGQVSNMPGLITVGACNGCHSPGGGVAKIVALYPESEIG
ncbi:MAG TPA: carboxypeptidase-like regulatory domain-containing protein [Steroidobacteraceae bacterium]|jgi:hypothetical protein|nr:carboxypeptidase-like regulatory domain-containing protein [Steroidobacteraceae bacterium]